MRFDSSGIPGEGSEVSSFALGPASGLTAALRYCYVMLAAVEWHC
jgi:hypothetical protein